jgi:uncharacterized membrane protein YoaK (UPF0700 family)
MSAHLAPGPIESELITQEPEPATGKIMRRSVLVVLSIVIGLAIAICHVSLTIAHRPWVDVIACGAVVGVVARAFSRHSPERWGLFALTLTVPALGLAAALGLMGNDVAKLTPWYLAPVLWLVVGILAAMLGKWMADRARTNPMPPVAE